MGTSRPCFYVDRQTEYSQFKSRALYLVGPARRSVLWAAKTIWNNHRWSVSKAVNAFKPSIERNDRNTTRDTIKWFCNMTMLDPMSQNRSKHTWKRWNGKSYPTRHPFSRHCSLYHLFRSMAHGLADQHLRLMKKSKIGSIRGSPQKMSSFFDAGFVRCPKDGRK